MAVAVAAGCAARGNIQRPMGAATLAPYFGPVCFLKSPIPNDVKAVRVGDVKAAKRGYGGLEPVLAKMAELARSGGGNVVTGVVGRREISALSWAQPVADGVAYFVPSDEKFDCAAAGGDFR